MKEPVLLLTAVIVAAAIGLAQAQAPVDDAAKGKAKGKGAPRNPAQSPASQAIPATKTPQTFTAQEIRTGEQKFVAQCGFCHGRDAEGGETGPDLTRSPLVAEDNRGDKIGPFVKAGKPAEGMPAFNLSAADLTGIVAFIHTQKTKFEALGGNRRSVDDADLATGNAGAGKRYFDASCASCHSTTGDLAGVAKRYQGLGLVQRMLYPSGRPAPRRPTGTVTLANGQTVSGEVAAEDEFSLTLLDAAGARQSYDKAVVKYKVDNPLAAHFDLLAKYTDADMHNVYAYLTTLK